MEQAQDATSFIKVPTLRRRQSSERSRSTSKGQLFIQGARSSSSGSLTESSPLMSSGGGVMTTSVPVLAPHPTQFLAGVNQYNLVATMQLVVERKIGAALDVGRPTCDLFAFAMIDGQCHPVTDCDAFERETGHTSEPAEAITLDQLCVDIRGFTRIYTEVCATVRYVNRKHQEVHIIVQRQSVKRKNLSEGVLGRLWTPYHTGYYYKIIGDFARFFLRNSDTV